MIEVVLAEISINDGSDRKIFQRRDGKAPTAPHRLAWFGGHLEPESDKSLLDAMVRELDEETSLVKYRKVSIGASKSYEVPAQFSSSKGLTMVHLFQAIIDAKNVNFEVYEGTRSETYTNQELLQRNDVASTVRFVLEHLDQ